MRATLARLRLARNLVFPLPRFLTYLMIAVFVSAGAVSGHHGQLDFGGSHPSGHGPHLASAPGHGSPQGEAEGKGGLDRTSCDFSHVSSCSMGHCCFPVPPIALPLTKADGPAWETRVTDWERREERQDPPPPRSA